MKNIRDSFGDRNLAALLGLLGLLNGCSANGTDGAPSPLSASESDLHAPLRVARHGVARPGPRGHAPPPRHEHCGPGGHPGSGNAGSGNAGSGNAGSGNAGSGNAGSGSTTGPGGGSGGSSSSSGGAFSSAGAVGLGICGDGQWGNGESCDDGNAVSGDGCSASCAQEPGWLCSQPGTACHQPRCGDSIMDSWFILSPPSSAGASSVGGTTGAAGSGPQGTYYSEQCDDGNPLSGDGCSATCELETGWICASPGVACHQPTCGDGIQDSWFVPNAAGASGAPSAGGASSTGSAGTAGAGPQGTYYSEECDDLNAVSGDGCSSECVIESGWLCPTPGTACHQPACGNGFIDFTAGGAAGSGNSSSTAGTGGAGPSGTTEQCDDLNTVSGDGCSATCIIEPGFSCDIPGACHVAVCGNGVPEWPAEQCDDGNQVANDGCHQCIYESWGTGGTGGTGNSAGGAAGH